jgi:hypothetical protein
MDFGSRSSYLSTHQEGVMRVFSACFGVGLGIGVGAAFVFALAGVPSATAQPKPATPNVPPGPPRPVVPGARFTLTSGPFVVTAPIKATAVPSKRLCTECTDCDHDGHKAIACGGDDCDDGDSNRYPGNTEICDIGDHDEDCNYATFGNRDADGDGYVDNHCGNVEPNGVRHGGNDCDDAKPLMHPGVLSCAAMFGSDYYYCMGDGSTFTGKCPAATPGGPPGHCYLQPPMTDTGVCAP